MKPEIRPSKPFGIIVEGKGINIHEVDVTWLRELVWNERLIVLRGFRTFTGAEDFANYCEKWGEVSVWPFGKVLELVERNNPEDHIFDNNYVPLHWDGMYRQQVPEFQLFHCVRAPKSGQGGRTTFSNTVNALENADSNTRQLWEKVTGHYQRKMEFYDSKTVSPIVDTHPLRGHSVIRYNEPPAKGFGDFINPPTLDFTGVSSDEAAEFHQTLRDALYAPENYYAHEWQEGDIVVADNFSLLHGREEFETKAPRHLRRVHVLSNPPLNNPRLVSHK
ncbi:MAG: TauD/TfdA family dioxygenase [Bdellovibrionaceae bacterium]|nr:TauD/TfdA family dioxygenase [Pseudobdellovibrionaceae bacterium]